MAQLPPFSEDGRQCVRAASLRGPLDLLTLRGAATLLVGAQGDQAAAREQTAFEWDAPGT